MAERFRNVRLTPVPLFEGLGYGEVYRVPVGKTALVLSGQAANVSQNQIGLSLRWLDADAQNAFFPTMLVNEMQIPATSAVNPIAGRLVLEENDILQATQVGGSSENMDLTVSVLEIDNVGAS